MQTMDLDLERIAQAPKLIDPLFLNSPQYVDEQLSTALGRRVLVKVETLNPLRSFKGRGVDLLARQMAPGTRMVCTSTGNFGQAVGYAATRHGLSAEVFVPAGISPVKLTRMRSLGACVHEVEDGGADRAARVFAVTHPGAVLVKDGLEPRVAEGAGTIGVELLKETTIDTVVLPVGDGALITGVGRMVVVRDEDMLTAMRTALETLGVLPEPAGAAGLAAIATHDLPGQVVATVITGANTDPGLFEQVLTSR